jgi:hypothetical protein
MNPLSLGNPQTQVSILTCIANCGNRTFNFICHAEIGDPVVGGSMKCEYGINFRLSFALEICCKTVKIREKFQDAVVLQWNFSWRPSREFLSV